MGTAFGAEGGVVSELSEYGCMRWIRCWVSTVQKLSVSPAGALVCFGSAYQ